MKAFIDSKIPWYVARTNVKAEEKAYQNLLRAGFRDVYLPRRIVEKTNTRHRTRVKFVYPLMPRYMFVGIRHGDFGNVTRCDGVEYILSEEGRTGKPIKVYAPMIEEIFLAERDLEFDETTEAKKYRGEVLDGEFPKGVPIRVKVEHLMAGMEGIVRGTNGKDKVVVDMRLGRVEFPAEEIERV